MKLICPTCKIDFEQHRSNQIYCKPRCQARRNQTTPERRARKKARLAEKLLEDPDYRRRHHYKTRFGITLEDYRDMLASQGGGCAICKIKPRKGQNAFAVDHDHNTGEIFGILCFKCNHRLIADIRKPELYEKAAEYLRKGTGRFVPDKYKKPKRRLRRKSR